MSIKFNRSNYESLGFYSMDMIYAKLDSTGITVPGEFVQELDEKAKEAGVQEVELFVPKANTFVPKNVCSIDPKKCRPEVVIVCSVKETGEVGDDNPDKCHMEQVCDGNNQNCQWVMVCDNSLQASAVTPKDCKPVVVIVCD